MRWKVLHVAALLVSALTSLSAAKDHKSGGFAAALTTPLDVAKTRIMLSRRTETTVGSVLGEVYRCGSRVGRVIGQTHDRDGGVPRLFAGIVPRSMWMALGGFIYFGAFETAVALTERRF